MRALAVVTPSLFEEIDEKDKHLIQIDDLKIPLAFVEGNAPDFDSNLEQFSNHVLVRKSSFSLNYRDLGIIEMAWNRLKDVEADTYYPIGSDFAGYVEEVGSNVTAFQKGDLVIGDCCYPEVKEGVMPGIPSNHSSREYEVYHQAKLIKVPSYISDIEAGTLIIGTQTAMSMVRKGAIKKGNNILVTSITSNTSFFLLNILWDQGCNVYGLSYSGENIENVKNHFPFIKDVFSIKENNIPNDLFFDVVLDAFSDTYLEYLSQKLNTNARYVTCGIFNQSSRKISNVKATNLSSLIAMMMRNVSLIANCLGTTDDLQQGLTQYESHKMVIDTVYNDNDALADFITKSCNLQNNKFGKVVYQYLDINKN
jgi:NADPH:quinone reductase-like Zn-dependent oxidoreductase